MILTFNDYVILYIKDLTMRIISISDIHYGHENNNLIDRNLNIWIEENKKLITSCDLFTMTGDMYHKRLSYNSEVVLNSIITNLKIAELCSDYKIVLRWLKGTDLHDLEQLKSLAKIISETYPDLDFKYIDEVSIEYNEDLDKYILYVPDNMGSPEEVENKISDELNRFEIEAVDIALTHIWYKHHVPDIQGIEAMDEEFMESVVKDIVINGHDHTPRQYGKIHTIGSFDRLRHNEEESKGGLYIQLDEVRGDFTKFLENKSAKKFLKLKLEYDDLESAIVFLEGELKHIDKTTDIMLVVDSENPVLFNIVELIKHFKEYNIKINKKSEKKSETVKLKRVKSFTKIEKNNITDLILSKAKELGLEIDDGIVTHTIGTIIKEFDK